MVDGQVAALPGSGAVVRHLKKPERWIIRETKRGKEITHYPAVGRAGGLLGGSTGASEHPIETLLALGVAGVVILLAAGYSVGDVAKVAEKIPGVSQLVNKVGSDAVETTALGLMRLG